MLEQADQTKPSKDSRKVMEKQITLLTPTYNRAYIISKLYHSLKRQTNKNFEWLVIDDGSSDETQALFDQWIPEETAFPIRYFKTPNGGKHRAVNHGIDLAQGEYLMVVDSDDYLVETAVEKLHKWIRSIDNSSQIMGVVANKGVSPTETSNPQFSKPWLDKPLLEMNTYEEDGKKVLSGERAMCFRTEFHRRYKYPEFEGEKFITEAVVYNRMANDGYTMRFYNDIIWIYEYLPDGLSHSGGDLYLRNPKGYGLYSMEQTKFRKLSFAKRFNAIYGFTCDMLHYYNLQTVIECYGSDKAMICLAYILHKLKNPFHGKAR